MLGSHIVAERNTRYDIGVLQTKVNLTIYSIWSEI